jgi:hypothetical protein
LQDLEKSFVNFLETSTEEENFASSFCYFSQANNEGSIMYSLKLFTAKDGKSKKKILPGLTYFFHICERKEKVLYVVKKNKFFFSAIFFPFK